MTGEELLRAVEKLGIKDNLSPFESGAFLYAARQAVAEISKIMPRTGVCELVHYPLPVVAAQRDIQIHDSGVDLVYRASGALSVAFEVCGQGHAVLRDTGNTEYEYAFGGDDGFDTGNVFAVKAGVIATMLSSGSREVELRFSGDRQFLVRNLAFYGANNGREPEPFREYTGYDLRGAAYFGERFAEILRVPFDRESGMEIPMDGVYAQGSTVYIRNDLRGVFYAECRMNPVLPDADTMGNQIDLDGELCEMLPVRCAYYLFLPDKEISSIYGAEYQTMYARYERIRKRKNALKFHDIRGWGK